MTGDAASPTAATEVDHDALSAARLDDLSWTRAPAGWEVLGHRFRYRTTSPALDAELDRMFGDLTPLDVGATDGAEELLSLVQSEHGPDPSWDLYRGERRIRYDESPARTVRTMMWLCNQGVIRAIHPGTLALHAGTVARDGRAVVMAAPQEAGKTTLTTALVRRGFDYLSDEAAAIDRSSLAVSAYPKPLTLDRGSWSLFPGLEPPASSAPFVDDQWHVRAGTIGGGAVVDTATPALLLAPRYEADGVTEVRAVGPAEMVRLLADSTFHFPEHASDDLRAIARLVEQCSYVALSVADLDRACDTITELLGDAP